MIAVNIKADLKPLQRAFVALGAKQVPFANSLALNALAKGVADQETIGVDQTFEHPTPFTEKAFRIAVATKSRPIAVVAAKDQTNDQGGQAAYLAPYVLGGDRFLGTKKGMLVPKQAQVNSYGNLPKGAIQRLKGKPNIYIGPIRTKSGGVINGVWQRTGRGARPRARGKAAAPQPRVPLKLLIRFEDTTPAPKHFDFFGRATAYIRRNAAREYTVALRKALATAR